MTQTELIDQIVYAYGQLAGKRDDIQDWLAEILREVETFILPDYTIDKQTLTLSGATTYSFSDAIIIDSVLHDDGSKPVFALSPQHYNLTWSSISEPLYFYQVRSPTGVTVYFNESLTDDVVFNLRTFTSLPTDPDTDVPELDHTGQIVVQGLHAKAALILKDIERFRALEAEYRSMLGFKQQPQESK